MNRERCNLRQRKTTQGSKKRGVELRCKRCSGPAKCKYLGDLTRDTDYYDTYEHTCLDHKCGWRECFTVFAGGAGASTPFSRCPECGYVPECYKECRK